MKVRRKYCKLHGWAPHKDGSCCRCVGVPGLTRVEKVKAFLRGFKLPRSVKARDYVGGRFKD